MFLWKSLWWIRTSSCFWWESVIRHLTIWTRRRCVHVLSVQERWDIKCPSGQKCRSRRTMIEFGILCCHGSNEFMEIKIRAPFERVICTLIVPRLFGTSYYPLPKAMWMHLTLLTRLLWFAHDFWCLWWYRSNLRFHWLNLTFFTWKKLVWGYSL
jgi:hypothetical protein